MLTWFNFVTQRVVQERVGLSEAGIDALFHTEDKDRVKDRPDAIGQLCYKNTIVRSYKLSATFQFQYGTLNKVSTTDTTTQQLFQFTQLQDVPSGYTERVFR